MIRRINVVFHWPTVNLNSLFERNQELSPLNYLKPESLRKIWKKFSTFISFPGCTWLAHICLLLCLFYFFLSKKGVISEITSPCPRNSEKCHLNSYSFVVNHKMPPRRRIFSPLYQFHTVLMTGFSMEKTHLLPTMQMRHQQQHLQSRKEKRLSEQNKLYSEIKLLSHSLGGPNALPLLGPLDSETCNEGNHWEEGKRKTKIIKDSGL